MHTCRTCPASDSRSLQPVGLMSHVIYPEDDGFVVDDVWRTESEGFPYLADQLRPLLTEAGLSAHEASVRSIWSFARP